jgi:N-methylhydantoinase B/oxoprolinase/acetone carboxylase alpha subunit
MHNNSNIPVEMIESELPLTISRYELLPDTGGAGLHRGGLGLAREWRVDCPRRCSRRTSNASSSGPTAWPAASPAAPAAFS